MLLHVPILDLQTQKHGLTIAWYVVFRQERNEFMSLPRRYFIRANFFPFFSLIFVTREPNHNCVLRVIPRYTVLTSFSISIKIDIRFALEVLSIDCVEDHLGLVWV